jgi:uncharacterized protein YbaR (Trm112 family)
MPYSHWKKVIRRKIMPVDKELLDILACPKCKGKLVLENDQSGLICNACMLKYRIEDEIPVMLIDEAINLTIRSSANGG